MNSTTPNLQSLIARVEKLESQNRRWKLAAAVLTLFSASLVLGGAKLADRIDPQVIHARSVEAQDFVLKDEDGRVHARLTMTPNKLEILGRSVIVGPGDDGRTVLFAGPALQFYDQNGKLIWTAPQKPTLVPATR